MRFFIVTLFLLPLTLFAQEMLWSSESINEVTQREYDEALEHYTKEKYPKEVKKAIQEKIERERERVRQERLERERERVRQERLERERERVRQERLERERERVRQEKLERERIRQEKLQSVTLHGLMWQDDASTKSTIEDWSGAIEYCQNLSFAGYYDWRLPSKEELESIVDTSRSPTIKKEFQYGNSGSYWSSTIYMSYMPSAWIVSFYNNYAHYEGKEYRTYVRCVRDGK